MKPEEEQDLQATPETQQQGYSDELMSDTGSLEKDTPKVYSSPNIYRLLFEDTFDSYLIPSLLFLLIISIVQFTPFYMGLDQQLPYIECSNNFCIAPNQEDLDNKVQTLCRGGAHLVGETHYFSLLHRIFLGYTAIMTNFSSFLGVYLLISRWSTFFQEGCGYKFIAYSAIQMILFFLTTTTSKVIDWTNMKPTPEYSVIPIDAHGCINFSVIYSYYRPDDLHNQFWILAAIYFPLFLISIFHFLWKAIKIQDNREWWFYLELHLIGASMLSGWFFSLVINYVAGIQFSSLQQSSDLFRIQQIVNFSIVSLVFAVSIVIFCKRGRSVYLK